MEILIIVGYLILAVTVVDVLLTTVQSKGAGAISNKIAISTWKIIFIIAGKNGISKVLNYAGLAVVVVTIFSWILLLYLAFFLIFVANPASILTASTNEVSNTFDKFYFIGYTLFTMGNGDFSPNGEFYQFNTALCTGTGLFLITLSITYLIPVVSAVVEMRQFSSSLFSIGTTLQEWLKTTWSKEGYAGMELQLQTFSQQLSTHNEKHLAYPVLHFFHDTSIEYSAPFTIALLNEYLIIVSSVTPEEYRPKQYILKLLDQNIDNYVNIVKEQYSIKAATVPPVPEPDLPDDISFNKEEFNNYKSRRELLKQVVTKDGWQWNQLY